MVRKIFIGFMFLIVVLCSGCASKEMSKAVGGKTNKEFAIAEALSKVSIKPVKLYKVDYLENKAVAFYKEKNTDKLMAGLFERRKNRWHFIIQNEILVDLTDSRLFTMESSLNEKGTNGLEMPFFYFSYGVIHDQKIKKLNLKNFGTSQGVTEVTTKIITIEGQKVWYLIHKDKILYNAQKAFYGDGKVIFDTYGKN